MQQLLFNGQTLDCRNVQSGAPQGSLLRPLLVAKESQYASRTGMLNVNVVSVHCIRAASILSVGLHFILHEKYDDLFLVATLFYIVIYAIYCHQLPFYLFAGGAVAKFSPIFASFQQKMPTDTACVHANYTYICTTRQKPCFQKSKPCRVLQNAGFSHLFKGHGRFLKVVVVLQSLEIVAEDSLQSLVFSSSYKLTDVAA